MGSEEDGKSLQLPEERVAENKIDDNATLNKNDTPSPQRNDILSSCVPNNKSVAFKSDCKDKTDNIGPTAAELTNRFQALAAADDSEGLEVRSDGNYEEEDGDIATSKSYGEANTNKKDRQPKRVIPPSDRFTRSVAKKNSSSSTS